MNTDTLIVTSATGVDVELAIAGPGSRAYAFIIDWHIRLLLAVSWFAGTSFLIARLINNQTKSPIQTVLIITLPATLIYFLYHPILEIVMRGRTPGKRMAGVRIVNRLGGTPSALAVVIRNAMRLIDSLPFLYAVGLVTTMLNAQRVRLGDLAAGTLLVRDGDTEAKALAQLGSLSLSPILDAGTVALGNDILLRWKELQPDTRRRLTRELLTRIGAITGKPQPPLTQDAPDDRALQQQLRNALAGGYR